MRLPSNLHEETPWLVEGAKKPKLFINVLEADEGGFMSNNAKVPSPPPPVAEEATFSKCCVKAAASC